MARYKNGISESKSKRVEKREVKPSPVSPVSPVTTTPVPTSTRIAEPTTPVLKKRLVTAGTAKGVSIFSNIPTINTKLHTKIFTGNEGATLQDIIFCNLDTSSALTLSVFISTIDINSISTTDKTVTQINTSLTGSSNTVKILNRLSVAANSSNTLSAAVGGLLNPLVGSGSFKFYVYCVKSTADGELDVTVIK